MRTNVSPTPNFVGVKKLIVDLLRREPTPAAEWLSQIEQLEPAVFGAFAVLLPTWDGSLSDLIASASYNATNRSGTSSLFDAQLVDAVRTAVTTLKNESHGAL